MAELSGLDRPLIVGCAAGYMLVVLAIGAWAAGRTRSNRDFFIAGQRIGLGVTALATMSAAFSGFVFLGGPGLTYRMGLASLFIVLPVSFTAGLLCWVLGRRLRLLSGIRDLVTLPEAIAVRFDDRWATGLAALAVVLGTVAYLGAQLLALGILLQAIFGLSSLALGMGLGLGVLLLYGVLGGMVAGVYTDVAQGTLMLGTAVAVFARALSATGGWSEMTRSIAESPVFGTRFLEPLGGASVYTAFGFLFVFGVGVLGQPQMLHKFYMIDDVRKLKWMPLVLASSQVLCLLVWFGVGLAVPGLVARGALAPLAQPDHATPLFLLGHASDLLAGLAFAGALAAIMSTADSFMNIGSAAIVRDLPRAFGRVPAGGLRQSRMAAAAVTLVAALVAYVHGDLIALLGTFAFGTFAAALAPSLALGLTWDRVTGRAAAASIATGLGLNIGLELLARQERIGWFPASPLPDGALPSAVALAASFAVLVAVSLSTRPGAIDDDVRAVMEG